MTIQGPMLVVAENPATAMVQALGAAGVFPIVVAGWSDAADAMAKIKPAALLIADPDPPAEPRFAKRLAKRTQAASDPLIPVLACVRPVDASPLPTALPVDPETPVERLIATLVSALRIRTLHATVLRRVGKTKALTPLAILPPDLLAQATVLCVGRGRSYPALSVAIGERVPLIGVLSIEAAARYLNTRDIEGIVVGDGFPPRVVEALVTVLEEDTRFRDLPIGVLGPCGRLLEGHRLPNLIHHEGDPSVLVNRLLPYVRMQAAQIHLKRVLTSLGSEGAIDPQTGLLADGVFWRDLARAISDACNDGGRLSVARFAFEDHGDPRLSIDAARLLSRIVRDVDLACRQPDGSLVVAFTETDLRSAHVVTRRIATMLQHTMLAPASSERTCQPTITLATLKPTDDLASLAARIGTGPTRAA
jgi:hypothetical protein